MQGKYYTPLVILCLILTSVGLVLNISKYKYNTKSREEMLAELGELKVMASRYLAALEWTTKDLRDRVNRLERYNTNLLQAIEYLTKDETFPELKPHPVKTIRIQQKLTEPPFWNSLSLEIPAEDASLVLLNSPIPQAMPPPIITRVNIIPNNQIPWQGNFRIASRVMKIPFTDWALVFSHGLKKMLFCADALLFLENVLPDPTSPTEVIIDESRKQELISIGEAPDYVEILFNIPEQRRLARPSEVFLDAMIKIYPNIQRRYPTNRERLSNLPFYRYFQPAEEEDQEEQDGGGGPLLTNIKIELETYKQAIIALRAEAEWHYYAQSIEAEWHYYDQSIEPSPCAIHVRLQSIDSNGTAFFTVAA